MYIQNLRIAESTSPPQLSSLFNESTSSELSVDVCTASALVNVPITCLEGIWIKAKKLMETDGALVPAPGQLPEARMVLSYSGKPPHMFTPKKMENSVAIQVVLTGNPLVFAPILLLWLKPMDSFKIFCCKEENT